LLTTLCLLIPLPPAYLERRGLACELLIVLKSRPDAFMRTHSARSALSLGDTSPSPFPPARPSRHLSHPPRDIRCLRVHSLEVGREPLNPLFTFAAAAPATAPLLIAAQEPHFAPIVCKVAARPPLAWIVPTPFTTTPNVLIAQGTKSHETTLTPKTAPAPMRAPVVVALRSFSRIFSRKEPSCGINE
jgi:hypothetical protein